MKKKRKTKLQKEIDLRLRLLSIPFSYHRIGKIMGPIGPVTKEDLLRIKRKARKR